MYKALVERALATEHGIRIGPFLTEEKAVMVMVAKQVRSEIALLRRAGRSIKGLSLREEQTGGQSFLWLFIDKDAKRGRPRI